MVCRLNYNCVTNKYTCHMYCHMSHVCDTRIHHMEYVHELVYVCKRRDCSTIYSAKHTTVAHYNTHDCNTLQYV